MGGREFNNDLFVLRKGLSVIIPGRDTGKVPNACSKQYCAPPETKGIMVMKEKNV